ncbi:MAG: hypothetical protein MI717_15185, partial [Spirochaetales bacterium]|nr:hypothetical protein [Spirochaetales bacterium]
KIGTQSSLEEFYNEYPISSIEIKYFGASGLSDSIKRFFQVKDISSMPQYDYLNTPAAVDADLYNKMIKIVIG